jgi:hypothetical protein
LIGGALLAVLGVGACTNGQSGSDSGSAAGGFAAPGAAAATGAAGKRAAARPADSNGGNGATGDLAFGTAKIRRAELHVVIRHDESVDGKADVAAAIALAAGGEVDADDRSSGSSPSATLVLRVPPEELSAVLHQLAGLGRSTARHLSTQDVTAKVADVESRVASARREIARLRELYQHAVKISDVITIEGELSERESDLESLEAQQRALTAETSLATVTLTLSRAAAPAPPKPPAEHHRTGFVGGLASGWDAFTGAAAAFATAIGAVLPFAVLLVVLALAGRLLWARLRPARPAPPT